MGTTQINLGVSICLPLDQDLFSFCSKIFVEKYSKKFFKKIFDNITKNDTADY